MARESIYYRQETEGNLLFAQYCCLELSVAHISEGSALREKWIDADGNVKIGPRIPAREDLVEQASMHLEEAEGLCKAYPGTTKGLLEEIEETKKKLGGDSFFEPVTSEERKQVLAAMANELSAWGKW